MTRIPIKDRKRKSFSKEMREQVYTKCGGHCAYCGEKITPRQMQIDHIIPFSYGGANDIDNCLPSCRRCNFIKNTQTLDEFRQYIHELPIHLKNNSVSVHNALRFGVLKRDEAPVQFYFEKENIKIEPHIELEPEETKQQLYRLCVLSQKKLYDLIEKAQIFADLNLKLSEATTEELQKYTDEIHDWCVARNKMWFAMLPIEEYIEDTKQLMCSIAKC